MNEIQMIKMNVARQRWAEQIQEHQQSGLTVKEWCNVNNISCATYYRRLRMVREWLLERGSSSSNESPPEIVEVYRKEVKDPSAPDTIMRIQRGETQIEILSTIQPDLLLSLMEAL